VYSYQALHDHQLDPAKRRGGARANAGRRPGSSAYGEATQAIRVPASLIPALKNLLVLRKQNFALLADGSRILYLLYRANAYKVIVMPL